MSRIRDRKQRRVKIRRRYRAGVRGTAERPRLAVYRSLRHVYAQLVDDDKGITLAAASTLEKELAGDLESTGGVEAGKVLGRVIADRAKEKGVKNAVFDRGGFAYRGVVRAVADAARDAGLEI
jgi:large subunit ribosomal protein L18